MQSGGGFASAGKARRRLVEAAGQLPESSVARWVARAPARLRHEDQRGSGAAVTACKARRAARVERPQRPAARVSGESRPAARWKAQWQAPAAKSANWSRRTTWRRPPPAYSVRRAARHARRLLYCPCRWLPDRSLHLACFPSLPPCSCPLHRRVLGLLLIHASLALPPSSQDIQPHTLAPFAPPPCGQECIPTCCRSSSISFVAPRILVRPPHRLLPHAQQAHDSGPAPRRPACDADPAPYRDPLPGVIYPCRELPGDCR